MDKNSLAHYESLPYRLEVHFDADDDCFVAEFPELLGCVAHGDTREEAIATLDAFKTEWLASALEEGATIPEPKSEPTHSGKVLLRMPRTLHERAVQVSKLENVSLNTYIVQAVTESVERIGVKQLHGLLDGLLQRVLGHVVPAESLQSILVQIGVRVHAVYGRKDKPLPADKQDQLTSETPSPSVGQLDA